jgi:adenylate cyclase
LPHVVDIGLVLLVIAALLGITVAAAVTRGLVRPVRRLLAGRKGEVARERLALRDAYVEALDAYRRQAWEEARAGFEGCLAIAPCDPPSKLFLKRIAQFCAAAPSADWDGVWALAEK